MTGSTLLKKVLVTGAGTAFGYEVAMRLAEKGFDVVAAVEIYGQMQTLKRQAAERGVTLQLPQPRAQGDARSAIENGTTHATWMPFDVRASRFQAAM